jgi:hypothetical protein
VENGLVKLAGGYFMTDAVAKVTAAPVAAEGLEFNNEPQALLTAAGEAENGVMYYYVEQTQQTSDELPMATNAGTYTIGYYAKGTNGYLDSEWYHIQVTIAPKVREDEGSTEVVQISPTQFNVTIDETGGTPTPIDNDLLDADGGIMVYVLNFIRELNETGDPYTVCLPCTPPTEDAIYYSLKDVVNNSELVFEEVANPLANTPYLVVPTTNTNLNKTLNSVRLLKDCGNSQSVGNFTMKGTQTGLTNTEAAAQGAYILQSGNEWKRVVAGSNVSVPPFRAYIVASGAAPARLTSSVGDATAIDTIHTIDQDGTERWYDMNGHRIAQPAKKGVYIINNKKVIKK